MNEKSIRDRLLEMEKRNPDLEERFEKEKKKMLTRKLTTSERVIWAFASLLGAYFFVQLTYLAIVIKEGPWLVRFGLIGGAVFGAAWTILGIWILKKGSFKLFRHENAIHGLTFGFALLLLITMLLLGGQAGDRTTGIQLMLIGSIFFLVFGIPALFNMRINRTESSLREQLLKIELQIAEIADKSKHE